MNYRMMTEKDLECVVERNIEYYNTVEDCCWTFEKAYKRIHQVLTMEDSMCMVQLDDSNTITGYLMGYFKEFDDIRGYFLEEIVIFKGFQGKGYGTDFLKILEQEVVKSGSSIIDNPYVVQNSYESWIESISYVRKIASLPEK